MYSIIYLENGTWQVDKLILGHRQSIMSIREFKESISKQDEEERAPSASKTKEHAN